MMALQGPEGFKSQEGYLPPRSRDRGQGVAQAMLSHGLFVAAPLLSLHGLSSAHCPSSIQIAYREWDVCHLDWGIACWTAPTLS